MENKEACKVCKVHKENFLKQLDSNIVLAQESIELKKKLNSKNEELNKCILGYNSITFRLQLAGLEVDMYSLGFESGNKKLDFEKLYKKIEEKIDNFEKYEQAK